MITSLVANDSIAGEILSNIVTSYTREKKAMELLEQQFKDLGIEYWCVFCSDIDVEPLDILSKTVSYIDLNKFSMYWSTYMDHHYPHHTKYSVPKLSDKIAFIQGYPDVVHNTNNTICFGEVIELDCFARCMNKFTISIYDRQKIVYNNVSNKFDFIKIKNEPVIPDSIGDIIAKVLLGTVISSMALLVLYLTFANN